MFTNNQENYFWRVKENFHFSCEAFRGNQWGLGILSLFSLRFHCPLPTGDAFALVVCSVHPFCLVTGSEEEHSPGLKTLERRAARKIPSKSLEDIPSDSSSENKVCPTVHASPKLKHACVCMCFPVVSLHAGLHQSLQRSCYRGDEPFPRVLRRLGVQCPQLCF